MPKRLLNILFEKTIKIFFVFGIVFLASDPGLVIGFPLGTVCVINVKNTSTRHCRGGGELQVTDLKNEAHVVMADSIASRYLVLGEASSGGGAVEVSCR